MTYKPQFLFLVRQYAFLSKERISFLVYSVLPFLCPPLLHHWSRFLFYLFFYTFLFTSAFGFSSTSTYKAFPTPFSPTPG